MSHLSLHVVLAFYGTLFAIGLNPDNCLAIKVYRMNFSIIR